MSGIVTWLMRPLFGREVLRAAVTVGENIDSAVETTLQERMSQSESQAQMVVELKRIAKALEDMAAPLFEDATQRTDMGAVLRMVTPTVSLPQDSVSTPERLEAERKRWNVPVGYHPVWDKGFLIGWEPSKP